MTTFKREITEPEYLVALVAGQVYSHLADKGPDYAPLDEVANNAIDVAEAIIKRVVDTDNESPPVPMPAPLPPGILHIDEFGSQLRDGSGKTSGIHVEWYCSDQIGPGGDTLNPDQVKSLFTCMVTAVEKWSDENTPNLSVVYDEYWEGSD